MHRRDISPRSQRHRSSDPRTRRGAQDLSHSNRLPQGQGEWRSSSDDGRDVSPRGQEYSHPETQTAETAQELLHDRRPTRHRALWKPFPVDRRDGTSRGQGHKSTDQRPTGLMQSLHLNERWTHNQGPANFELEPIVEPPQFTRRRRNRRPPRDEEKGQEVLKNDGHLNQLSADQEMQSSSKMSLPLGNSHLEGREDVTLTTIKAKDDNANRFWRRWTHIQDEGISLQDFKARVMLVRYSML